MAGGEEPKFRLQKRTRAGRNLVAVPPPANGAGAFSHEPRLWVNSKGDGGDFTAISISYVHNALVANASLRFSEKVNSTLKESTSYTSLMWSGERSGPSAPPSYLLRFFPVSRYFARTCPAVWSAEAWMLTALCPQNVHGARF